MVLGIGHWAGLRQRNNYATVFQRFPRKFRKRGVLDLPPTFTRLISVCCMHQTLFVRISTLLRDSLRMEDSTAQILNQRFATDRNPFSLPPHFYFVCLNGTDTTIGVGRFFGVRCAANGLWRKLEIFVPLREATSCFWVLCSKNTGLKNQPCVTQLGQFSLTSTFE